MKTSRNVCSRGFTSVLALLMGTASESLPHDDLTPEGFPALLARVKRDLDGAQARWALIGGLAVGARSQPRFTRDLDIAKATSSDPDAEGLIRQLLTEGYQIEALLEQTALGRLATVRLRPPEGREIVDLLFASSGIEPEIVKGAEELEVFPSQIVPVACRGDLIAMKILARDDASRPQDRVDILALLKSAVPEDLERARTALRWVTERGSDRGRDLQALLLKSLEEFKPPSSGG